jgi:hypothetical protein
MIDVKEKLNPSNKVTISSFIGNWATKMIDELLRNTPTSNARNFTKSKLRENNS